MVDELDTRDEDQAETVERIRKTLADGFAFVRSREVTASIAAISFEELLARGVRLIEEDENDIRPGRLNAVRRLKEEVADAVAQAQRLSAESFAISQDVERAANTRPDGSVPVTAAEREED